jgi:hypothetical protein
VTRDRELQRLTDLHVRFGEYIEAGIPRLKRLGYNPTRFLELVRECGDVVNATKRLLASAAHTSYGFQRLLELGRLQDTVEFAACLPWFQELFDEDELYEARTRLILHEFPLDARIRAAMSSPPEWVEHV